MGLQHLKDQLRRNCNAGVMSSQCNLLAQGNSVENIRFGAFQLFNGKTILEETFLAKAEGCGTWIVNSQQWPFMSSDEDIFMTQKAQKIVCTWQSIFRLAWVLSRHQTVIIVTWHWLLWHFMVCAWQENEIYQCAVACTARSGLRAGISFGAKLELRLRPDAGFHTIWSLNLPRTLNKQTFEEALKLLPFVIWNRQVKCAEDVWSWSEIIIWSSTATG